MYQHLPIILKLQDIDAEIDKLKSKKDKIPVELRVLDAELIKYKNKFQTQNNALEELQKERRSKERQLLLHVEKIEKYKTQRLSVKTNKEYAALESEIADLEEANSTIEDEILELMISIDEATDNLEIAKNDLKANEDKLKEKREILLFEENDIERQIAKWDQEREGFVGDINSALMNRYNKWRIRRGGSMVATIVGQSCGGCHLNLPPQLINEVRKEKELHTCNSCGRILYWKNEKAESEEQN